MALSAAGWGRGLGCEGMNRGKAAVVLKGDATCFLFLLLAELTASGFERGRWGKAKGKGGQGQKGRKMGKGGCGAACGCADSSSLSLTNLQVLRLDLPADC